MSNRILRVGLVSPPDALNPLTATTEHSFTILNGIYGLGGVRHPKTGKLEPWLFESWELNPDKVGTDDPTVIAELREEVSFSDGTPLTASDFVFTVEYSIAKTMAGAHGTSHYDAIDRVHAPDPDGKTVHLYFSRPDNSWRRGVLGYPILPKHVWENVDDPSNFEPTESGTPVGAGHLRLEDYSEGDTYRLTVRNQATIWTNAIEWLDDDGPFVDGVEFKVYGSKPALEEALLSGECDAARDSVTRDAAERAEAQGNRIVTTPDTGWDHFSFNTRRTPLDDPAFRQLLVKLFDREFAVSELYTDGTRPGSYVTPSAYSSWRPPEPWTVEQYDGTTVPSLSFPGENSQLGESGVGTAREFLLTHDRAYYDYQFERGIAPSSSHDDRVLTVAGDPLPSVVDGPLTITVPPPSEDEIKFRIAGHWLAAMSEVGIPARLQVEPLASLSERAFERESFDIFGAGWRNIAAENDHFTRMFSSRGADLEATSDEFHSNAMGYTDSDELIERQASLFDPDERRPLVKKLLVQIWKDAPTLVTGYRRQTYPVSDRFEGYAQALGGIARPVSWLSVREKTN